jgi:hypothetical protein
VQVQSAFPVIFGSLQKQLFRLDSNVQLQVACGDRLDDFTANDHAKVRGIERACGGSPQIRFYALDNRDMHSN